MAYPQESAGETIYRALTRKNSLYVSFIMVGAILGERMVENFVNSCWEANNQGKFFEDIPNLGELAEGDE